MFRKVYSPKFKSTHKGEIVWFHGKLHKVVEANADVAARLRELNFIERFCVWVLDNM